MLEKTNQPDPKHVFIEVESPGLLLPGLTVEDMKHGVSQIRNPIIARVFRELDLIEQWGSGVPGIFREAETLGLQEPIIEKIGMRVRFTVYLKEPVALFPQQSRKSLTGRGGGRVRGGDTGHPRPRYGFVYPSTDCCVV